MDVEPLDRIPVGHHAWEPPAMDGPDRRHAIPWEWFDAALVYFTWIVLSSAAAFIVVAVSGAEGATSIATQILVSVVLLAVVTLTWVRIRGAAAGVGDAVRRTFGVKEPVLADAVRGVAYGVAAFIIVQLALGLLLSALVGALGREVPKIQEEVQSAVQGSGATPLLVALSVALLAPLGEELLYRGVLYQALAKRLPGWPTIGLTGLAFGLTHVEPFVIVLTFPLGMALTWMMRRHGTLLVPYVAHVVFNAIGVLLIRTGGG